MKNIFLLFSLVLISAFSFAQNGQPVPAAATSTGKLVKWYTIQEALELSKKEPRKIFMDVYTDWCGWCKKMDATTFENPIVANYLNQRYYPVKFNAEVMDTILFKGKKYGYITPPGQRGYNELAPELMHGAMTFPTVVFLDEQLNNIQAIPGYREAQELDRILKFFGDNYYRNMDYDSFLNTYVSPFIQSANKPATTGN